MKIHVFILSSLICGFVFAQDSIYFDTQAEAQIFGDSIDKPNEYPRGDADRFQNEGYDSVKYEYYHFLNKVSEKGLSESDSAWVIYMRIYVDDSYWYDGVRYVCIKDHKSKDSNKPPDEGYWNLFVPEILPWVLDEDVIYGDVRSYETINYICIKAHKTKETNKPPDSKYWEVYIP